MKTKEELTAVKEKAEAMNEKVRKLTDEELLLSSGGAPDETLPHSRGTEHFGPEIHDSAEPQHDSNSTSPLGLVVSACSSLK